MAAVPRETAGSAGRGQTDGELKGDGADAPRAVAAPGRSDDGPAAGPDDGPAAGPDDGPNDWPTVGSDDWRAAGLADYWLAAAKPAAWRVAGPDDWPPSEPDDPIADDQPADGSDDRPAAESGGGRGRFEPNCWQACGARVSGAPCGACGPCRLRDACADGDVAEVRRLTRRSAPGPAWTLAAVSAAAVAAATSGHPAPVQWLVARFAPTAYNDTELSAFWAACAAGRAQIAQWLVDHRPELAGLPKLLARASDDAWANGRVETAAWLFGNFAQLRSPAARSRALRAACTHGQLAAARWAAWQGICPPPKLPAPSILALLRDTCARGHHEVARWLADEYLRLPGPFGVAYEIKSHPECVRACAVAAVGLACEGGHFAVATWLTRRFDLRPERRDLWPADALRKTCLNGRLDVAQWLLATFRFSPGSGFPLHLAYRRGHGAVAERILDLLGSAGAAGLRRYIQLGHLNWAICDACEAGDSIALGLVATYAVTAADLREYHGAWRHPSHAAERECVIDWYADEYRDATAESAAAAFAVPAIRAACAFEHYDIARRLAEACGFGEKRDSGAAPA